MSTRATAWLSVSDAEGAGLSCAACGSPIDREAIGLDHHASYCPTCHVESIFLPWKGRPIQLIPDRAPPPLAATLRSAQRDLDELDFVELLCALEEIADALGATTSHR